MWNFDLAQPVQLYVPEREDFGPDRSGGELKCTVTGYRPELGLDFRFHAGYGVSIPFRQLNQPNNRLDIVLRITPREPDAEPVYLRQTFSVPEIPREWDREVLLEGAFLLGAGHYSVELRMHDIAGRACLAKWTADASFSEKDRILSAATPRGGVQPVEATPFDFRFPPVGRPPSSGPRVKVIVNFAPQNMDNNTPDTFDIQGLASVLRTILREPGIAHVSVVACAVRAQQVFFRSGETRDLNLSALQTKLRQVKFATVDIKALHAKQGETDFLRSLMATELSDPDYDALIFVGPKFVLDSEIPDEQIKSLSTGGRPLFYLNYSVDPSAYPWRDSIGRVVRHLRGREYSITLPRDFFAAWSDLTSHLGTAAPQFINVN